MKLALRLLLCLILFSGIAIARSSTSLIGKAPPEIDAQKWFNSKPLTLAGLKGKVVVVEFWASWCPPCRTTIPHLLELQQQYKSKGVVFISLSNESASVVEPFIQQNHMTYAVGAGSGAGKKYQVTGIPHAVVVGKNGKVMWEGHPMQNLDKALRAATR